MNRLLAAVLFLAVLGVSCRFASAQEEDLSALAVPDTVFTAQSQPGPVYETSYDRDRTRGNWLQSLSYFHSNQRTAFSLSGAMTTQDFIRFANRVTLGGLDGHLDSRLTRRWVLSLNGHYDMYSSNDGVVRTDSRSNKLQIRTQYSVNPTRALALNGSIYSEFQQKGDRTIQNRLDIPFAEIEPDAVDSLIATRDSSYTTGRQDGFGARADWTVRPWLIINGTATASRLRPFQRSLVRNFATALDSTNGMISSEIRESTREPSDNSNFASNVAFTRLPRTQMLFGFQKTDVDQSNFDRQLRGQERYSSNKNAGTAHVTYNGIRRVTVLLDAGITKLLREYALRRTSNSLATTRTLGGSLVRSDTSSSVGITGSLTRSRYERQSTQNGLVIDRRVNANGRKKLTSRFVLESFGSISLQRSEYLDPSADQDQLRSLVAVGGGYAVSPRCSTSVRFSSSRNHSVSLDPSASSTNAVQQTYQMNASLLLTLSPDFIIRQGYLLSADYRIFDYIESNNYLNRVRRIDTDMIDTVFSFAFVRLTHNFIFRDQGSYSQNAGDDRRYYRVSSDAYEQTLSVTAGLTLLPGIRLSATQSLLNQRNHFLSNNRRTNRNRFNLNGALEINRTLVGGLEIKGALRHIGGYDEVTPTNPLANEEDYWIAGATVHKDF